MNLPHRTADPDYLLRRVLQANAAFSTLCGLVWIAGGEALGTWFGRDGSMAADGAGLLVFAALLIVLSTRSEIPPLLAAIVVVLDVLWVVDAGTKIAAGNLSTQGAWVIGIICLAILDFAAFQTLGIYRGRLMRRSTLR
jgi:hypothetical protein